MQSMFPIGTSTEQGADTRITGEQTNDSISNALSYVSNTLGRRLTPLARSSSMLDVCEALTAAVYLMSSAASPTFVSREARRRSFEQSDSWSRHGASQSVEDMVESGFFYLGEADHVKCFFCDLGLRDWDAGDQPELEHVKFSPLCFFLKSSRGLDWMRRSSTRPPNYPTSYSRQDHNGLLKRIAEAAAKLSRDFAKVGFCRTKTLLCIARSIISHGRSPANKELVGQLLADESLEHDDQLPLLIGGFDLAGALSAMFPIEETQNETQENDNDLACRKCRSNNRQIVFLPCGHLICCQLCAEPLDQCLVQSCGSRIANKIKAYIT